MTDPVQLIYEGKVVKLLLENIDLPNGETMTVEVVRHSSGSAVAAIDDRQRICLLRQYRHAAGGWLWELPAGKLEPDEPPEQAARRELEEEAGIRAKHWTPLGHMIPSPGFCTERVHLYLARNLTPVATAHDTHEVIEVHWLPLMEAKAMEFGEGTSELHQKMIAEFALGIRKQ